MLFFFFFFSPSDDDIQSYLPTLMETMLSALNNTVNLKLKELAVSAIGAIGNQSSHEVTQTLYNSFVVFVLFLSKCISASGNRSSLAVSCSVECYGFVICSTLHIPPFPRLMRFPHVLFS